MAGGRAPQPQGEAPRRDRNAKAGGSRAGGRLGASASAGDAHEARHEGRSRCLDEHVSHTGEITHVMSVKYARGAKPMSQIFVSEDLDPYRSSGTPGSLDVMQQLHLHLLHASLAKPSLVRAHGAARAKPLSSV